MSKVKYNFFSFGDIQQQIVRNFSNLDFIVVLSLFVINPTMTVSLVYFINMQLLMCECKTLVYSINSTTDSK